MNISRAFRSSHLAGTQLIVALVFAIAFAWPATAAPIITATKDDNLAAGLRKLPGNTITYTITGLTPPTGSLAFPSTGGTRPTIAVGAGTGVTLANGNSVLGLNVTNSAGHGITGSAVGTLTLADFDVTVTGGSALSLTTSGTVTATGTDNDLSSTTGTALNVNALTIAAAGITFKSIASGNNTAAADPASGIILNNTGAGGLTVTGDGGATNNGSGGTIQFATGAGVSLASTSNVSLGYMNITNGGNDGLNGSSVNGLTLTRCSITNNGNAVGERDLCEQHGHGHPGAGQQRQ